MAEIVTAGVDPARALAAVAAGTGTAALMAEGIAGIPGTDADPSGWTNTDLPPGRTTGSRWRISAPELAGRLVFPGNSLFFTSA